MFPKRSGLVLVLVAVGCGGDEPRLEPAPVTYEQLGNQVGRLADELRWGCSNAPAIRRAANRVERSARRVEGGASDREAKGLAAQAVEEAQDVVSRCP